MTTETPKPTPVTALDRLAGSRARLRGALLEITHPPKLPPLLASGVGGLGKAIEDRVMSNPIVSLSLRAVKRWWEEHPMNGATGASTALSSKLLTPYVRRNSSTFVLIAGGRRCGNADHIPASLASTLSAQGNPVTGISCRVAIA